MSYLQEQEELISQIKLAPNRVWINNYFDLIRQLIIGLDIRYDDPRIVISMPGDYKDKPYIPVSINYRYVLASDFENGEILISFILSDLMDKMPQDIRGKLRKTSYFEHHPNLIENVPPGWYSTSILVLMHSNMLRVAWLQECLTQLLVAKSSIYRKSHRPIIYDAVLYLDFRKMIFDKAFPE